jgi:hypothetical protein
MRLEKAPLFHGSSAARARERDSMRSHHALDRRTLLESVFAHKIIQTGLIFARSRFIAVCPAMGHFFFQQSADDMVAARPFQQGFGQFGGDDHFETLMIRDGLNLIAGQLAKANTVLERQHRDLLPGG